MGNLCDLFMITKIVMNKMSTEQNNPDCKYTNICGNFSIKGPMTKGAIIKNNPDENANIEVTLSVSLMCFSENAKNEGHIAEKPTPGRLNQAHFLKYKFLE